MKTVFGHNMPLPGNTEPMHPMDAVMGLGRTHRFGGNANLEWKVLHHSMLVALLWLKSYGAEGVEHALLHDVHEYITGDIPTPVKNAIGREACDKMQDELDARLYEGLEIQQPDGADSQLVTIVDHAALFIEADYIGAPNHVQHLIDTSISGYSQIHRRDVWNCVKTSFPDVAKKMVDLKFFEAPINGEPAPEPCMCKHSHTKVALCPVPGCRCDRWRPVGDCGGSCCSG